MAKNERLRVVKQRRYIVWVKGDRFSSQFKVWAETKQEALFKCAYEYGLKTIQCDAKLDKGGL